MYFGIKINPNDTRRIAVSNDININSTVESLRDAASKELKLPPSDLELIYCGNQLKDGRTLKDIGLRCNATIHVLKKTEKVVNKRISTFQESDVPHLVQAFKNATRAVNYRTALQRLSRPSVLENIIAATPGLENDPVALAIIQDPELVIQLCDSKTVKRIMKAHPALAEAAQYIVTVVHEEATSASASTSNPGTGYAFSLETLSDDDDDEASSSSELQESGGSAITSAQLAAALRAAAGLTSQPQTGSNSSSVQAESGRPASSPFAAITPEMLGRALGHAMATSATLGGPPANVSPAISGGATLNSDLERSSRLTQNLQQMRELGLRDDTLNMQALQASDWNVHEAINLILSGAMADFSESEL